jgi:hypothetical protein
VATVVEFKIRLVLDTGDFSAPCGRTGSARNRLRPALPCRSLRRQPPSAIDLRTSSAVRIPAADHQDNFVPDPFGDKEIVHLGRGILNRLRNVFSWRCRAQRLSRLPEGEQRKLKELLDRVVAELNAGRRVAVCVIVATKGSTPQALVP